MRAMKDSGIERIGEIPERWDTIRLGALATFIVPMRDKPTSFDGNIPWIRIEDFDGMYISKSKSDQNVSMELIERMNMKIYPVGTVLCSCSCNLGQCAITTTPMCSNQTFIGVVPSKYLNNRFLYYVLSANEKALNNMSQGAIQSYLSQNDFSKFKIAISDVSTQIKVADYLDAKCAEIDELIEAKEKTDALLRERRQSIIYEAVTKGLNSDVSMKDSGVEWIGEIPEHWEVRRLKVIAEMQTGTTPKTSDSDFFDGDVNWFTPADFSGNMLINESERKLTQKAIEEGQVYLFPANTIMLVGIGATVGKTAFTQVAASCNQQITAILTKEPERAKYYAYWLSACSGTIKATANYTTLPIINNQHLGETFCPYANSVDEQTEITEYLDRTCAGIDGLISANEATIQKLKEYRQSIIYEAVTGKIEI